MDMSNRAPDWLKQAEYDLRHARNALKDEDFEWACFAAQQSAEKAVKALFLSLGGEGLGHSITRLLSDLTRKVSVPDVLFSASKHLDKHYIPTRYPNGFDAGASGDYYTKDEVRKAIEDAVAIYDFCHQHVHGSGGGC
jgi:HEPN domain-containing protein